MTHRLSRSALLDCCLAGLVNAAVACSGHTCYSLAESASADRAMFVCVEDPIAGRPETLPEDASMSATRDSDNFIKEQAQAE